MQKHTNLTAIFFFCKCIEPPNYAMKLNRSASFMFALHLMSIMLSCFVIHNYEELSLYYEPVNWF